MDCGDSPGRHCDMKKDPKLFLSNSKTQIKSSEKKESSECLEVTLVFLLNCLY